MFKVGAPPGKERKREFVDNANGLFSAQAAPKPPRAMYSVTEGMKVGGRVMAFPFISIHTYIQHLYQCLINVLMKSACSISLGNLHSNFDIVHFLSFLSHFSTYKLSCHYFLVSLQRTVIVPPEAGYGPNGMNEIPVRPLFCWL